jgi:hypothetical protein
MKNDITTKLETLTPEWALDILENHNPCNRAVSEPVVQAYANDMINGRWVVTHQGMAFDADGNLVDGQHRCWAVVFSGKTIQCLVTRNLPVKEVKNGLNMSAMDVVDLGLKRNAGTQLTLSHGIKNGAKMAAACRGIAALIQPGLMFKRFSTASVLAVHKEYGNSVHAVMEGLSTPKRVLHIMAPLAMYHYADPVKALAFRDQISTMESMGAPALAFVRFLECSHRPGDPMRTMRGLCECLYAMHENKPIKQVRPEQISGYNFLISLSPSVNQRIRSALKQPTCNVRAAISEFKATAAPAA